MIVARLKYVNSNNNVDVFYSTLTDLTLPLLPSEPISQLRSYVSHFLPTRWRRSSPRLLQSMLAIRMIEAASKLTCIGLCSFQVAVKQLDGLRESGICKGAD